MSSGKFESEPIWKPNRNSGERMKNFMQIVEKKRKLEFGDYWDFHKWSVEHIDDFWAEFWDFCGFICSKTYDQVINLNIPMEECPKWFEGAKLNFAQNLLRHNNDHVALLVAGEDRDIERVTYKQLHEEAKLYSAAFRKIGLKKGDRVSCYMSNRKEAVIAMLGVTSIGGIWTGGLPLLGAKACLSRIKQVEPKILITVDQFPHNKETKQLLTNIKEVVEGLPSLEKVIIVPSKPESKQKDISGIKNSCFLEDFLNEGYNADGSVPDIAFEQVSFSHPLFINYTSGTTGLPKTIVHGFGGLFPGLRDFWLHWNSQKDEIWLSVSPVGWISWNMVTNFLFAGETVCLFEGLPYLLTPTYLWDLVDEVKMTRIFMSPSIIDEIEAKGYLPTEKHSLSSLNMILSAGSIVKPSNFDFIFKKLKNDIMFSVGFGCTENLGFCLITEQTLPNYRGEIIAPCLGVAAECLDEAGNPITGVMGEFVISKPMPSLPLGFWGDFEGKMWKKSYFSKYPGKFAINDVAVINPITKGIIICGRSDETLKPRGCRFGSSEIYNIVEKFPEVRSSLCVAQYSKIMDERAVLFLKIEDGYKFSTDLEEKIRKKITEELTGRHVPDVILEVPDIPINVNGKKMEMIIKKIINNMPHNVETVANIECLKFYYNSPQLKGF